MKIYHNNLGQTLKQGFKPIWLVFGDEPWQKNDSLTVIKDHAKQQGFNELIRFSVDDKFDWQGLVHEYQSLSLFSDLRIIEVELITGKVGAIGSKVLSQLVTSLHQDVQLIFHGPKLEANLQKSKWFKALEAAGCFLPLYDIEGRQLNQWLHNQTRQLNLNLHPDVFPLLIELFEGNLLALSQELQKLVILFGSKEITVDAAEQLVIKQAKFNPFQVIDALLMGNTAKCIAMLDQLQQEGTAIGQLIWFVHKEIQQLFAMLEQIQQGTSIKDLYQKYRIWDKRKPLYQYALNNIRLENIAHAQARLAQVDLLSKTTSDFNAFILLADVCISLYHGDKTSQYSLDYEFA
jgi:DNA polymerase-3 subunit delta